MIFLKKYLAFFVFFSCLSLPTQGQILLQGLPDQEPDDIFIDKQDRFFPAFGGQVYAVRDSVEFVNEVANPDRAYSGRTFVHQVDSRGELHTLFISAHYNSDSKTTYSNLHQAECIQGRCQYRPLASWSNTSGSNTTTDYSISESRVSKGDQWFSKVLYSRTFSDGKNYHTDTKLYHYVDGRETNEGEYQKKYTNAFPAPQSGISIGAEGLFDGEMGLVYRGKAQTGEKHSSRYKKNLVWDENEAPHFFYHDPSDRSFYHRFFSPERGSIVDVRVDEKESGQEITVFIKKNELWSLHYFYRNPFNKGILVTVQTLDGKINRQFVLDGSKVRNAGWEMKGATSSGGRAFLTYLADKNQSKRKFVVLKTVDQLETALAPQLTEPIADFREHKKEWEFNFGAGLQQVTWDFKVGAPKEATTNAQGNTVYVSAVPNPYNPKYQFSDSLLKITSIEGKAFGYNLGVEAVSQAIKQDFSNGGTNSQKKINQVKTKLAKEQLFFDFDVQFSTETSNSAVFFEDLSGQAASKNFDFKYNEQKLSLLTFERHHFGLLRQKYNFYQHVYIYRVPQGSTAYEFYGQGIGDVEVESWMLHYGYSRKDYLVKYETTIDDWFVDGEARVGMSTAKFAPDLIVSGGVTPTGESTFVGGVQLEGGWIWYKRWESLGGAGGLVKLSYRYDYALVGSSNKPTDLDQPADSEDYKFAYERTEVKHGPVVFVSLNF